MINLEAHPWLNQVFFPRWCWFTLHENEQLWLSPAPSAVNSERAHEQCQQLCHQWAPCQILLFLPIALHGQSMKHPATDPYLCGSGLGSCEKQNMSSKLAVSTCKDFTDLRTSCILWNKKAPLQREANHFVSGWMKHFFGYYFFLHFPPLLEVWK